MSEEATQAPDVMVTVTCGPHKKLRFPGPGSVEQYDQEAGEVGACLQNALMNEVYRGTSPSAQREVFYGITREASGIEPAKVMRASAEAVVGSENVSSGERTMVSEDAAFFLQEVPGCYFLLGAANPQRGLDASHHNPSFDFDEDVLELGVAVLAHACAHYLM